MTYTVHTPESAPEAARPILAEAKKAYGFVPNLYGVMAEAPTLLKAYRALDELFEQTSLKPVEKHVVMLTASAENGCSYCVAAHSVVAAMAKVPDSVVEAIRGGTAIPDPALEALRRFTAAVVNSRGWPTEAQTTAFLGAGYTRANLLEVILGVGLKTLSNYTNHVAETPLDAAFAKAAGPKAA